MHWRLLLTPALGGPDNMALDVALMARARRTGESVLRVYSWNTPTLSLGRNQRALGVYDAESLARHAVDVVRRPTGGRALLHHREITYSVTAPALSHENHASDYASINLLLLNALAALGVPAEIAARRARAPLPGALPCFAVPAAGELTVEGRKLAGSAQWRDDGALLQQGSILVDDDQGIISGLLRDGEDPSPVPAPATLRELLAHAPTPAELADRMLDAIRQLADPGAGRFEIEPEVQREADRLADGYRDPRWTWRR